jgi:mRNA-degrading endonuclease RelE of RelBE toxin-antitoxin system
LKLYFSNAFRELLKQLPPHVQKQVKRAFEHLAEDSRHPSLHFKRVNQQYSIRINHQYRALGDIQEDGILWDWIGLHDEYERRIRKR